MIINGSRNVKQARALNIKKASEITIYRFIPLRPMLSIKDAFYESFPKCTVNYKMMNVHL